MVFVMGLNIVRKTPIHRFISTCAAGLIPAIIFILGCRPVEDKSSSGLKNAAVDQQTVTSENRPDTPMESPANGKESQPIDNSPEIPAYATVLQRKVLLKEEFGYEEVGDPPPLIESPTGLKYRILDPGTGAQVNPQGRCTVNFLGRLSNNMTFDSLLTKSKVGDIPEKFYVPVIFDLPHLIPAWKEALPLLKEGGIIELEVPPSLGYGEQSKGAIPANSTLFFLIKLLNANPKTDADLFREVVAAEEFKRSDSGVYYKILKPSEGKKPALDDRVTYRYWIKTIHGELLVDRILSNEPKVAMTVNMPRGVGEGIKMIGEGGVIELMLHPGTGYGRHSQDEEVPDNQFIRMRIEVDKVEKSRELRLPGKS